LRGGCTVAVAQDGGGAIGAGKVAVDKLPPQWGFRRWASTRPVSRPDRQTAAEPPAGLGEVLGPLRSLSGAAGDWRSNVIQRDYELERRSR
jgi:hypothetical protein